MDGGGEGRTAFCGPARALPASRRARTARPWLPVRHAGQAGRREGLIFVLWGGRGEELKNQSATSRVPSSLSRLPTHPYAPPPLVIAVVHRGPATGLRGKMASSWGGGGKRDGRVSSSPGGGGAMKRDDAPLTLSLSLSILTSRREASYAEPRPQPTPKVVMAARAPGPPVVGMERERPGVERIEARDCERFVVSLRACLREHACASAWPVMRGQGRVQHRGGWVGAVAASGTSSLTPHRMAPEPKKTNARKSTSAAAPPARPPYTARRSVVSSSLSQAASTDSSSTGRRFAMAECARAESESEKKDERLGEGV